MSPTQPRRQIIGPCTTCRGPGAAFDITVFHGPP
jgi:hypothetical protein